MALVGTGTTSNTFSGVVARYLKETTLVSGGHIMVQGGFNDEFNIPRVKMSDAIQANSETPASDQGTITFDNAKLKLNKYDVFIKFNPQSLKSYWSPFQADGEFNFKTLPAHAQSPIASLLLNQVGGYNDIVLIQGDTSIPVTAATASYRYVNGLIKKALAASEVFDVTGATTLTASNVISEMERSLKQAKKYSVDVRRATFDPNFKLFVSQTTFDLYGEASRAKTYKSISHEDATPGKIQGIRIVALPGMPDNRILGAVGTNSPASNIWMGTNDTGDFSSIKIDRWRPESELFFMKMTVALDTAIVKPEEVFLY